MRFISTMLMALVLIVGLPPPVAASAANTNDTQVQNQVAVATVAFDLYDDMYDLGTLAFTAGPAAAMNDEIAVSFLESNCLAAHVPRHEDQDENDFTAMQHPALGGPALDLYHFYDGLSTYAGLWFGTTHLNFDYGYMNNSDNGDMRRAWNGAGTARNFALG